MGFVRKLTGQDAAERAAKAQEASANQSIGFQRDALKQIRGDLQPFREAGGAALDPLTELVTNPQAQANFLTNNPIFNAISKETSRSLMANRAARGKLGSGGTAAELQNRLLAQGDNLINNQTNRLFNLSSLGSNAAARQGTATQGVTNAITNLNSQAGNARSAGIAAGGSELSNLLSLAGGLNSLGPGGNAIGSVLGTSGATGAIGQGLTGLLALCDERLKHNIEYAGQEDGVALYSFNYYGDDTTYIGPMAQELAQSKPELVHEIDGVLYADYEVRHAA